MNMDIGMANRALFAAGIDELKPGDVKEESERFKIIRDYYLSTMLEAMAKVEWSGAKRRRSLTPTMKPHKQNAEFRYAFDLPMDCAKPVSLDAQEFFRVESGLLYCNTPVARLLYITNGKRLIGQTSLSAGNASRRRPDEYITGGDAQRNNRFEEGDNIITGGNASRTTPVPPPEASEHFPDYQELRLEPQFYHYWEKMLSSKAAMRFTDNPNLHVTFFQEAALIGQEAAQTSIAQSAAKRKAPAPWADELGLR
jgi:hypothetical protein